MVLCERQAGCVVTLPAGGVVDTRHELSDYDFDAWQGGRCNNLSELDECLLDCLSKAGTVAIGEACYERCLIR